MSTQNASPTFPFSYERKCEIVNNFIEAYLSGQVKILKITIEDLKSDMTFFDSMLRMDEKLLAGMDPNNIKATNIDVMVSYYHVLHDCASMLLGWKKATDEELHSAVDFMMKQIWLNRTANRIDGEFLAVPNLKSQVKELQETAARHTSALEELKILMKAAFGSSQQQ
ncbi:MAG: hypothetical protein ABSA92_11625 [Candidatus Bathyarchaeia archaeon]|jgi:hypothetical protein